jgi:Rrf2 family protein
MRVSMKVDYGVRVLVDLAQHYGHGLVQTGEIAYRQGIPEPYLDQLLTYLRKAGFILSKRGPQGGHSLARPPSEINLGEVISALEGSTSPRCVQEPAECPRSVICVQREVWRQIEEAAQKLLQATTIMELAEQEGKRQEEGIYYI